MGNRMSNESAFVGKKKGQSNEKIGTIIPGLKTRWLASNGPVNCAGCATGRRTFKLMTFNAKLHCVHRESGLERGEHTKCTHQGTKRGEKRNEAGERERERERERNALQNNNDQSRFFLRVLPMFAMHVVQSRDNDTRFLHIKFFRCPHETVSSRSNVCVSQRRCCHFIEHFMIQ